MKYDEFVKESVEKCGLKPKRLDINYAEFDSRCWTAILGKDNINILVTYHVNRTELGDKSFDVLSSKYPIMGVSVGDIFDTINSIN